jgi:integrase
LDLAHKRFRNNRYHYTVSSKILPNGRVYLTFDNEAEGDEYTKKLESLLAAGKVPQEFLNKKHAIDTVADAIDAYLDNLDVPESDQLLLGVTRKRIGITKLSKLNYAWADEYVSTMKANNLSPSTIRHHVGALARCLDWIKRRGDTFMLSNPLRELPKRYASGHKDEFERDRRLSAEEEAEVMRIIMGEKPKHKERGFNFDNPQAILMLFMIAIETGMRLSEIFTLEKNQIDLTNKTIFLEKTKNGTKRQVPMTSTIHNALKTYLAAVDNKLFEFEGTNKAISARLSQTFGRIFEAAECGEFTYHGLRHEATCRLYERTNLSDVEIAKILGWKSLKMALRYTNLRASDLSTRLW